MPAMKYREVFDRNIPTLSSPDGFVAGAFDGAVRVGQVPAPNHPLTENGNVVQPDAPDQAVLPVVMAKILIGLIGGIGFRVIVANPAGFLGADEHGFLVQIKANVILQMNGIGQVTACGKKHGTPALPARCLDRSVNGGGVDRFPVTDSPKITHAIP
jgi:hypothetical protein